MKMDLKYLYKISFKNSDLKPIGYSFISYFLSENKYKNVISVGMGNLIYAISEYADTLLSLGTQAELNDFLSQKTEIKDTKILTGLLSDKIPKQKYEYDCIFINRSNVDEEILKYSSVFVVLTDHINIRDKLKKQEKQQDGFKLEEIKLSIGTEISIFYKTENKPIIPDIKDIVLNSNNIKRNSLPEIKEQIKKIGSKQENTGDNKYAIFVASDEKYLPFLNVLLNSIHKHKLPVDVYLLYYNFNDTYLRTACSKFNFPIYPIRIEKNKIPFSNSPHVNNNLFIKQARFFYLNQLGKYYDAICLLDSDMFITTKEFMNLFDLVKGTDKLIGCNEAYKWQFDNKYRIGENKEILFKEPITANKFHCSVPIIFDVKKWLDVIRFYCMLSYNSFEVDSNEKITKPIGDIFCWNISVYKLGRENDIILFPMEVMTQVHNRYFTKNTALKKSGANWTTESGDLVYTIHGRIGNRKWRQGQIIEADKIGDREKANNILREIEKEWYKLNVNTNVSIYDYMDKNDYWETLK